MTIRLILVSNRPDATEAYRQNILDDDVVLEVADSFLMLYQSLSREAYHGVMIDMPTKIKAPHEEKDLVNEVLDRLPVIQLAWDANSRNIRSFFYGQSRGTGRVQDFIANQCRKFTPTKARFEKRLPAHFNVRLLAVGERLNGEWAPSVTINISRGGGFIYAVGEWRVGERVRLVMQELEDFGEIEGEICWGIHWGTPMKIPGFGIRFLNVTEEQHTAILKKAFY